MSKEELINDLWDELEPIRKDAPMNDDTDEYPYRTGLGICRAKYRIEAVVEKYE